jgi:hypothetical protein
VDAIMATTARPLLLRPLAACLVAALGLSGSTRAEQPARPQRTILVTNCLDNGSGSLRDAVDGAISLDVIDMTQLTCSRISLSTGAILVGQQYLVFFGPGRDQLTIDASASPGSAVLYALNSGVLHVQGLTIANGSKYRSDTNSTGGCIHAEDYIRLVDVDVVNCIASASEGHAALGGAVFSRNGVAAWNSNITGNLAIAGTGNAGGGGIYTLGDLILRDSTLDNNTAYSHASSYGGGAFTRGNADVGNSTISHNAAQHDGGLALEAGPDEDFSRIIDSTISGNVAQFVGGGYSRSRLVIYNSTIAFNQAQSVEDLGGQLIGAGFQCAAETIIGSTIIANNTVNAVSHDLGATSSDLTTLYNTLVMSATPNVRLGPSNITDDPLLGPLANNGGPTRTHALLPGSPAIDTGNNGASQPHDQREEGFPRTIGPLTDIGAFEFDPDSIFLSGFD